MLDIRARVAPLCQVVCAAVFSLALLGAAPGAAPGAAGLPPVRSQPPAFRPQPVRPLAPDTDLTALLQQVAPQRLKRDVATLVSFGTRHTLSSQTNPKRGIGAARRWLESALRECAASSGGRMQVEVQSFWQEPTRRVPRRTRLHNVLATLQGTATPERVYLVSGHYDSRATDPMDAKSDAPGADDDASGVAVVLEACRLLAPRRLRSTVVFAALAGEEQGLLGAEYLAAQMQEKGTNLGAMVTNDIVGSSRGEDGRRSPRTLRLFAEGVSSAETPEQARLRRATGGENDSPSRQLSRFALSVAENSQTGMRLHVIQRRDRYMRGGDHIPFARRGVAAIRLTEPHEDYRHQHQDVRLEGGVQYGDLLRFCDFEYVAGVARVNLALLWSLAQAPAAPQGVKLVVEGLGHDTVLTWPRSTEPGIAGYDVLWRATTAPDWVQHSAVGASHRAVLPLSKDDLLFGVRAVGRDGKLSPVSFPEPSR